MKFSRKLFDLQEQLKPYSVSIERAHEWFLCYPEEIDFKYVVLFAHQEIARCQSVQEARERAIAFLSFDEETPDQYSLLSQMTLL